MDIKGHATLVDDYILYHSMSSWLSVRGHLSGA